MKKIILVIVLSIINGCSVYQATHAPAPVDFKSIKVGMKRSDAIAILGMPKLSDATATGKIDHYEFHDGYSAASKVRILPYIAGDIFSAGLAELIFWPLEENVFDGTLCTADLDIDKDNFVKAYDIQNKKGEKLWVSAQASEVTTKTTSSSPEKISEPVAQEPQDTHSTKLESKYTDSSDQLKKLNELKHDGLITNKEYKKRRKTIVDNL